MMSSVSTRSYLRIAAFSVLLPLLAACGNNQRGALYGAAVGGGVGFASGYVIGSSGLDGSGCSIGSCPQRGISFGLLGFVVGAVAGAVVGSQ